MKPLAFAIALFSVVLGLSAVNSTTMAVAAGSSKQSLAGSEWVIVSASETDKRFLGFEAEGRAYGHAGCNRFFGSYEVDGGNGLTFGQIGATKMLCPELQMAQEREWFAILEQTRRFERDGEMLKLVGDSGETLAELVQRD